MTLSSRAAMVVEVDGAGFHIIECFNVEVTAMTDNECLLRAQECEDRSKAVSDRELSIEWALLSMEWHYLVSQRSQHEPEQLTFE